MNIKVSLSILFILIVPLQAQSQGVWNADLGIFISLLSSLIIGVSAITLGIIFWTLIYRHKQEKVFKCLIFPFVAFCFAVACTYLIDAAQSWFADSAILQWSKSLAAVVSLACLIYSVKTYNKVFRVEKAELQDNFILNQTADLAEANRRLQLEIEVRKQAEKEVAKREKRFRALIENISDGIVLHDESFRVIYQSPSVIRILGYSFEGRQPKPFTELIHSDDRLSMTKLYEDLAALPGQPLQFQYRFSSNKVEYIWLEGVAINLLHDRNVNGYITNYRDISSRKKIEEELGHERALLRALIDNVPDYIYIKDVHLRHVINNKANVELIGASSEAETIGKTVMDYFDPVLAKQFMEADRKVLHSGLPLIDQEEQIVGHNNETRWLLTTKIPLTERGETIGLIGISRDITDRKRAEILLKELNASLAIQASKLSASNAELEQFAYVVSHDLQEPLRMVKSFLELLKKKYRDQLDEEATQYISIAVDGADRMKELIKDLLEYSRLDVAQADKFESVDMNQVVQETIQTLHASIQSSGAQVIVKTLPTIIAVKTQLGQVMQNLIANAIIYRASPAPVITIEGEEHFTNWKFSVTDNGMGIEERHFEKIFEIFQRLPNENVRKGTGLGLAICKKTIENHNGNIWVESRLGSGSTFHFTIGKNI